MATITKYEGKGKIPWQVKVRKGGKYHSASFPTKKLAEDWSRDLEHQITQEKYFPERAQKALSHTVGELIDIYCDRIVPQKVPRTQRYQRRILTWWKETLGDTHLKKCHHFPLRRLQAPAHDPEALCPWDGESLLELLKPVFFLCGVPEVGLDRQQSLPIYPAPERRAQTSHGHR